MNHLLWKYIIENVINLVALVNGRAAGYIIGLSANFFEAGRCDCVVAADTIIYKGSQLGYLTLSNPLSRKIYYPGTDSPVGCGANSQYYVSWTIRRL